MTRGVAALLAVLGAVLVVAAAPHPPAAVSNVTATTVAPTVTDAGDDQQAATRSNSTPTPKPAAAQTISPAFTPEQAPAKGTSPITVPAAARPVTLRVPAIAVSSTLEQLALNPDRTLQPPQDFDQAGWFDGGPKPGDPGPAVIAGHVDSTAGPAVFYRLGELRPGDQILIDRADATTAVFTVDRVAEYPKAEFPDSDVYGWTAAPNLRLITCSGTFDHSTGHYQDNTVVYATLTQT